MKKELLFLIVLALASPIVFAETKTIVRETKGQGINRDEAIKKALRQAVAQTKGVAISSLDTDFAYRSASADIERKPTGKKVEFDALSVETGGTTLRTDIAGLVKTYEVLDEKKIDDLKKEKAQLDKLINSGRPEGITWVMTKNTKGIDSDYTYRICIN